MSERITGITPPKSAGAHGIQDSGRRTRAEMIAQYRYHYEYQLEEAKRALAVPDGELLVETYLGPWARKRREVVID